jgi:hypothetical protein
MSLEKILVEKRDLIVEKWFDAILATYPEDARKFLAAKRRRITNPVGSTISGGVSSLFDHLVRGTDLECDEVVGVLDDIIRIRAIQEFTPAQALGFIFQLKTIVREAVWSQVREGRDLEELLTFEAGIDKLSLLAFNIYMQCREKIYELKTSEFKRRYSRIVDRASRIWESQGESVPEELKPD